MMLTTPPSASAPYRALAPVRTTSMRSIISTGRSDRSVPPCRLSFMRTPSTSTRTWPAAEPLMRTLFTEPAVPLSATSTPTVFASASAAVAAPAAATSSAVITVTVSGLSSTGVAVRVAVTTTSSIVSTGSADADATTRHRAANTASARMPFLNMTEPPPERAFSPCNLVMSGGEACRQGSTHPSPFHEGNISGGFPDFRIVLLAAPSHPAGRWPAAQWHDAAFIPGDSGVTVAVFHRIPLP